VQGRFHIAVFLSVDLAACVCRAQVKTILGINLRLVPETGRYDPTKLINFRTNRWASKPGLGYSQRWGHWIGSNQGLAILSAGGIGLVGRP